MSALPNPTALPGGGNVVRLPGSGPTALPGGGNVVRLPGSPPIGLPAPNPTPLVRPLRPPATPITPILPSTRPPLPGFRLPFAGPIGGAAGGILQDLLFPPPASAPEAPPSSNVPPLFDPPADPPGGTFPSPMLATFYSTNNFREVSRHIFGYRIREEGNYTPPYYVFIALPGARRVQIPGTNLYRWEPEPFVDNGPGIAPETLRLTPVPVQPDDDPLSNPTPGDPVVPPNPWTPPLISPPIAPPQPQPIAPPVAPPTPTAPPSPQLPPQVNPPLAPPSQQPLPPKLPNPPGVPKLPPFPNTPTPTIPTVPAAPPKQNPLPPLLPRIPTLPRPPLEPQPPTVNPVPPTNPSQNQQKQRQTPTLCQDPCLADIQRKLGDLSDNATTKIKIKIFRGCKAEPDDEDLADYDEIEIEVPQSEAANIKELHDRIFELQMNECRKPKPECIAAVPEWWQVRLGADRPQLIVQYAEVIGEKANGDPKYGAPNHIITIPHYRLSADATNRDLFPPYQKGQAMSVLTLADNSKLILNCISQRAAQLVNEELEKTINSALLDGAHLSIGNRKGQVLKTAIVYPRIVKYFANGQKNTKPTWIKYFNEKDDRDPINANGCAQ